MEYLYLPSQGSGGMAVAKGVTKLLYVVVVDDDAVVGKKDLPSFRYTRSILQSSLQLMGCKAQHAIKIIQRVFETMRQERLAKSWLQLLWMCPLGMLKYILIGRQDVSLMPAWIRQTLISSL